MIRSFLLSLLVCSFALAQPSMVTNPSLETLGENNLPAGWRTISTWGPKGKFASDDREHHTGQHSIRIEAAESSQNFLATDGFAVSPGDVFACSGWVKAKDVKLGENGKVLIEGVCAREDGNDTAITIAAIKLDGSGSCDWTHVEGEFKIPAQSSKGWVRFGMRDASGTVWWDDLQVQPKFPVAARIDTKAQQISPASGGIPVTIINRDKQSGQVKLVATLGKTTGSTNAILNGDPETQAIVPIQFDQTGVMDCTVSVIDAANHELFKQKRKVNIPAPLTVLPPVPTHWAVEDGPANISGEIDLRVNDQIRQGASLTLDLRNTSGSTIKSWKSTGELKDGWNHWEMSVGSAPIGDYILAAKLTSRSGQPITGEQQWHVIHRADSKVVLNDNGYLEYKGKPILPLGIFNGGGHMKEMAECGMTVTHAYNAMDVVAGEPPQDNRPLEFLDQTQQAGLMCLCLLPRQFVFKGDWDAVRRRIRMFKNHPALLAWDEEEGLARGDMKPADLVKLVQIIREEDPNHPIMIGDPRDAVRRVTDRSNFFPIDQMDLGMWWWYPLPLGAGKPSALDGEEAAKGLELAPPSFLTERNTNKPIWVGVQSYKKPASWGRYPTPVEYRAQAYISMICGAKGLMWYGGGVEGGVYGNLKDGHWDDLKALAKELREMAPVFMEPTGEAPKFTPENALISVMLKTLPGRTVILAANRASKPQDVKFSVAGSTQAKVLYENRSLSIRDGMLADHFEPYAVHVYELSR